MGEGNIRNLPCRCGSNKKYKKCCMDKEGKDFGEVGVLRFAYDMKDGNDDFYTRFLMQMSEIRSCAYPKDKHLEYDKSYSPISQNLLEARIAKQHCEKLIDEHIKNIQEGRDGIYHGHQIDIKEPIDDDLNMYFKDFFIRGIMAIDCLIRHTKFMECDLTFLFFDVDQKKYNKGLGKFPLKSGDPRFVFLADMIKNNKTNWYSSFRDMRVKIEHDGFSLPHLKYRLAKGGNVEAIFPSFGNQSIKEVMEICWQNITNLCEETLVFLLSLKLKDPIVIVMIPENMRDEHLPVRYAARHKDFPQAKFSC